MNDTRPTASSLGQGQLNEHLAPELARRNILLDAAQEAALVRLQRLYDALIAFKRARASIFRRWLNPPVPPRGAYFWGGVGRGKSFLMDAFYAALPYRRKTRVHFHAFMKAVHDDLRQHKNAVDPLAAVAARIARRHRVICFDEFHVSDVADAMILGRLLTALFEHGTVFVMTSNYRPEDLYPNGLQRENLLPTIALLKQWLDVIQVDGGIDYRLRQLQFADCYYTPLSDAVDAELSKLFEHMRPGPDEDPRFTIEARTVKARKRAGSLVWFDFATLCESPRSQLDYLELARRFAVVILSGVPRLTPDMGNAARRFTWLVDVFYDHRVKLLLSAAVPADELYREGPNSQEFPRTVSRLIEMRTHEYMALPHQAGQLALTTP
ncbi:MAG TPA: cell division protein ZapE [Casimicrobiaceae bacterium]|jgi:cell division protein ZapE|nr:cell division protein ZapE [Casimicrobiaceae bacterium]